MVIGYTTPSVGVLRSDVTLSFQTVRQFEYTFVVLHFACSEHQTVALACLQLRVAVTLARSDDGSNEDDQDNRI